MVAGKRMDQEGLAGVEVPASVMALTALGSVLQELLFWSAKEAESMSSSSGNVHNTVTSSGGVFGAPEQLFAPPGIQLVVLLWAARGLGVVGPLLLPFADTEVPAIYVKGVAHESRSSRSRSNNIEGMQKSGNPVEEDVGNSSSSIRGAVENCSTTSSSSATGRSSSSTEDEGIRGVVVSGVKHLDMLMTTSLCLIKAMDNWQSAASCSSAAAEPTAGAGHCLSSAGSAAGRNSSSAQGKKAAARGAAAAVTAAAVPLVAERKVRSVGADPSSSSSSAGDAMPAAPMTSSAAVDWPVARDHRLESRGTAHNSSSSSTSPADTAAAAAAAPRRHGTIPKLLAKLPGSGLPAAVVDQLNLIMSKWDLKRHRDDEGRYYIDVYEDLPRGQEVEFVGYVVHLAEVLLADVHTPLGCSNPGCVNLAGPSEIQLARKSCNACNVVYYCSRECQTAHWSTHKHLCKKLKQQQGEKQQGGEQGEQGTG